MPLFEMTFLRETDDAILVEDNFATYWLPKSQIDYTEDPAPGERIDIEIPEWLAEKKDLP
jgi:hypothetical protein